MKKDRKKKKLTLMATVNRDSFKKYFSEYDDPHFWRLVKMKNDFDSGDYCQAANALIYVKENKLNVPQWVTDWLYSAFIEYRLNNGRGNSLEVCLGLKEVGQGKNSKSCFERVVSNKEDLEHFWKIAVIKAAFNLNSDIEACEIYCERGYYQGGSTGLQKRYSENFSTEDRTFASLGFSTKILPTPSKHIDFIIKYLPTTVLTRDYIYDLLFPLVRRDLAEQGRDDGKKAVSNVVESLIPEDQF